MRDHDYVGSYLCFTLKISLFTISGIGPATQSVAWALPHDQWQGA
jgi:hypothetical protein